jgi:hypothetical protein
MRVLVFSLVVLLITSCVSEKEEGPIISDATLYSLSQSVTSFSYYRDNHDTLNTAPQSPHFSFVRIRFNPKARSAMNDSISGLKESAFPDESMIVKEMYSSKGGPLQGYVVMYKMRNASNSSSGWVWNEMKADGTPLYSAALKGGQCTNCHSTGVNTDLVRTFSLH